MKKVVNLLGIIALLFIVSIDGFAQQDKMYENFDPAFLNDTHREYTWNFNPIEYESDIVAKCINDIIGAARKQYNYAAPLQMKEELTNAAKVQAEYMAKKEEKTQDNVVAILKTPEMRAVNAGATKRVVELVTRAKATKGNDEYSYYDMAKEAVLSLLTNAKTAPTLLDKRYTYIGVGCNVDAYNKNCYISIVLGNDLSFNRGEVSYKNTTYTRKNYGLQPYEEKVCRKCEVRNIESLHKYLEIKGDAIYFNYPNAKLLKKIIGKDQDGFAVDIVQHSQFPCNSASNDVDYNFPNRGILLKYITYPTMIEKNEITDPKDKGLKVYMGSIPSSVSGSYDINLIIIKEKHICKTIVKTNINQPDVAFKSKTSFIPDLNGINTTINYMPLPEQAVLEFKIPFEVAKSTYESQDIAPLLDALDEPKFDIDSVNITAYTSFEGNEASNIALQKKRSESIVKAMGNLQNKTIPYNIQMNDGWDLLVNDIPNEYQQITKSKNEAKNALKNAKTKKDLEPILKNHRFAHVRMNVTYDVSENYAPDFMVSKFNKCMAKGDLATAFAIQKYLIKCVEDGTCTEKNVKKMNIPETAKNLPFLTNKYYMLSLLGDLSAEDIQKITDLPKMDNTNLVCEFNAFCSNVENMDITSSGQIAGIQSKIDRYYNNAIGKQYADKVDALNISLQYKVLDFLNNAENSDETLIESTYDKIKSIALPTINNWQKAYEVAATFIKYGDYDFARTAMDPYIDDENISEDFIFTYLNLYSLDETVYMSKNFEKACQLAVQKNKTRFCNEIKTYSYLIRENRAVQQIICSECK